MSAGPATRSVKYSTILTGLSFLIVLLLSLNQSIHAQYSTTIHSGYTPTGVEQGAAAGSYPLSGFENINLFNGSLGVALPLKVGGGRGTAGYTMTLQMDKHWEIYREFQGPIIQPYYQDEAQFRAGRSWRVGYSPGVLLNLLAADSNFPGCPNPQGQEVHIQYLTRLSFVMPDGAEVFLYDKQYGGAPFDKERCLSGPGYRNRGKVFASADGESMTFISDDDIVDGPIDGAVSIESLGPSGHLMMKDGTRYRIESGLVRWIRDRNGNKISFDYQQSPQGDSRVTSITDSLNRVIDISYAAVPTGYDEITFKGFGQAQRSIKVWYSPMANILRPDFTIKKANQLFPEVYAPNISWHGDWDHNPTLVSQIELPDQRLYQFRYNSYGEVARIILPTGGGFDYEHAGYAPAFPSGYQSTYDLIVYRRLAKRTVFNALTPTTDPLNPPAGTREKIEDYVVESPFDLGPTIIRVEQRDSGNTLKAQSKHYFYGNPALAISCTPINYSWWPAGKEYKTENFDVSGGTAGPVLLMTDQIWSPTVTGFSPPGICFTSPPPNPKIAEVITTLVDNNQVAKQSFGYDQYNNQTDVWEYDYGSGSQGALLRHTRTQYLTSGYDTIVGGITNPNPAATIHIRNFPTSLAVYSDVGTTNKMAETTYEYDDYATADGFHAQLVTRSGISGLCDGTAQNCPNGPNFTDFNYTTRGNVTKTTRYLLASDGSVTGTINSYMQYDVAGNAVKSIDGRENATEFIYDDRFGTPNGSVTDASIPSELAGGLKTFAFVTSVKNALLHTTFTQYDYYIGKPVDIAGANGLVTKVDYKDLQGVPDKLDRPTQIVRGANLTGTAREKARTLYTYDDSAHLITTKHDLNNFNDGLLKSESLYDGLGRTTETRKYENASSKITSKVAYDAMGRVEFTYNPHRTTIEDTYGWTKTTYDGLSRVTSVESFDDNGTPTGTSTGAVQPAYSGNRVLVSDQAGKQRISKTDGLGRLVEVWEVKPSDTATESISFPGHPEVTAGYRTTYAYNALNSLTTVTQRVGTSGTTQTRTFEYDSLQRLTKATNPESGIVSYFYDNNGNLSEKQGVGLTNVYSYDALNRITSKTGSTEPTQYYYDNQTLPFQPAGFNRGDAIGRLVAVRSNLTSPMPYASFYSYDVAGRVKQSYQRIDGTDYGFTYNYNRADVQTSVAYPSGRGVTTTYDGAGRIASMTTTTSVTTNNLSSAIAYSPAGALTSETYGNGFIHTITYNSRLQPTSINLGFEEDPDSVFKITYLYGKLNNPTDPDSSIDASKNNGNIARKRLFWDDWQQYSQTYRYDSLNRIQDYVLHLEGITDAAHEYVKETYEYDRFGNRGMNNSASTTWGLPLSSFNPANNRINLFPEYAYSSVGNLVRVPLPQGGGTTTYGYNGDNKIVSAGGVSYEYNAEGQRVKISGLPSRKMVYNAGGQLIAEYNGSSGALMKEYFYRGGQLLATIDAFGTVKFGTPDHLGSVHQWTLDDGSLDPDGTHDYTPFGIDLYGNGSQSDGQRQQFTGKERDEASGLDYFGARYYSNVQGRFTSVDPENAGAIEDDPQSWNGYAYARDNPLLYSDPGGRKYKICSPDGKDCYEHSDNDFKASRRTGRKDGFTFTGDGGYFEKGEIRDQHGNVIATYEQTSLDDPADVLAFHLQLEFKSGDLYKRVALGLVSGAITGHLVRAGARARRSDGPGAMRRYEYAGSSKHGPTKRGNISAAPRNGQDALDASVEVKGTSSRRVGIDYQTGEFVVFDETHPGTGIFHGHVRSWDELTRQMQNALIKSGFTTKKGKIE